MPNETEVRSWTAHHEAGHAVATLLRGGELTSVTIVPTDQYWGLTTATVPIPGRTFAVHAGPWSEARFRWPFADRDNIEAFSNFMIGVWEENVSNDGDSERYEDARVAEEECGAFLSFDAHEIDWDTELEDHWSLIQQVAQLLLVEGTVEGGDVVALYEKFKEGRA